MNQEFIKAIEEIEKEKGISKNVIIDALEVALVSSYKKDVGSSQNVIVDIDRESGDIYLAIQKDIVEEVEDESLQISLEEARKTGKSYEIGDIYQEEIAPEKFGRIATQTAKQVVMQRIKDAERDVIFEDFTERENELIIGEVQRNVKGNVFVDLGRTEAILPISEQIRGENYSQGNRYKMLIVEVSRTTKGPQIILSRSHPNLVKRLFELEVPEIQNGEVEIYSIAREAGSRTKIAVFAKEEDVDPLGACVGFKGSRVNSIIDELHDEKIDIIMYEKENKRFIANALSPSKVEKIFVNEKEKSALVIVPDYQLSLAIGKEGQNARLAAKLTNWRIDIKSGSQFEGYLEENGLTEEDFEESFSSQDPEVENVHDQLKESVSLAEADEYEEEYDLEVVEMNREQDE